MRLEISLQQNANPKFAEVARMIAKGDPPEWLLVGLTHFSGGIGTDTSDVDIQTIIEKMQDAAHVLITWLPIFNGLALSGYGFPKEVGVALHVLPQIKKDLDRFQTRKVRPLDAQRIACAAVVARAWKIIHGKPSNGH